MTISKKITSMMIALVVLSACGGARDTEKAAQAMERARAAEAPRYASQEFQKAADLYRQMTAAVDSNQKKQATEYAKQTVTAANEAAARARENKANELIVVLGNLLNTAQKQGLPNSDGQLYNQAAQAHIDALAFRDARDFEKSIISAQNGIDMLESALNQTREEARQLLERARQRHADFSQLNNPALKDRLDEAGDEIRKGTTAFDAYDYGTAKNHAQRALDILEEIAALAGEGRRTVGDDNLQLQAYQLLRQLGQVIDYLRQNNYTNDVDLSLSTWVDTNTTKELTNTSTNEADLAPQDDEMDSGPTDEEIFQEEERFREMMRINGEFSSSAAPLLLRAQNARKEIITFKMIEDLYNEADTYYKEGNYISSIDSSREGLRLADLYLSAQTMAMHTVIRGDTLWDISGKYYRRNYFLWPNIWNANKLEIKDPDLIYPRQVFRIPPAPLPAR
ncbi:MAG: LysM peptidoglycan-binding domain-containing protein [Brevinema sp.]